jgi:hypothetical protein
MDSTEILNEIKNQLEQLEHKGYDKNSFKSGYLLGYAKALQLQQPDIISSLKFKLEVNAGRLCEPILQAGKNPKDDAECHKAFLMLAHLEAIEDYLNCL